MDSKVVGNTVAVWSFRVTKLKRVLYKFELAERLIIKTVRRDASFCAFSLFFASSNFVMSCRDRDDAMTCF